MGTHADRLARIRGVVTKYEREVEEEASKLAIEALDRLRSSEGHALLDARRELERTLERHHAWEPSTCPGDPGPGGRLTPHMLAVTEGALALLNGRADTFNPDKGEGT